MEVAIRTRFAARSHARPAGETRESPTIRGEPQNLTRMLDWGHIKASGDIRPKRWPRLAVHTH